MRSIIIVLSIIIVSLGLPEPAESQVKSGTVRLHLDTLFMGYLFNNYDPEEGEEVETGTFSIGLGNPRLGIGFGLAVIDQLVIGGRFTGYLTASEIDEIDYKLKGFQWGILPYVQYLFLTGVVRPFIIGQMGFSGLAESSEDDRVEIDRNRWGFVFGGGGGVHFFLGNRLSIDLTVLFDYSIGRQTEEHDYAWDIADVELEATVSRFEWSTLLGLSGWF